jgi:hypothetical protein
MNPESALALENASSGRTGYPTVLPVVAIRQLYISPGHNFFGRHGRAPGTSPMIARPEVECVAGRGLRGDRFFDFKKDYVGQVTFFAAEVYRAIRQALNVSHQPISVFRRNIITEGVDLNALIGMDFEIQGVRFRGMAECSPCYWMNAAFGDGAEKFLKGRGGLRAIVLSDGNLRVDA